MNLSWKSVNIKSAVGLENHCWQKAPMKYKVGLSIPEKQTSIEDVYRKTCNGVLVVNTLIKMAGYEMLCHWKY